MGQIRVCYKCQSRELGCHSVCEKYVNECEKNKKLKDLEFARKKMQDDIYESRTSRKRRRCC